MKWFRSVAASLCFLSRIACRKPDPMISTALETAADVNVLKGETIYFKNVFGADDFVSLGLVIIAEVISLALLEAFLGGRGYQTIHPMTPYRNSSRRPARSGNTSDTICHQSHSSGRKFVGVRMQTREASFHSLVIRRTTFMLWQTFLAGNR